MIKDKNRFLIFVDNMITRKVALELCERNGTSYSAIVYSDNPTKENDLFDEALYAWTLWDGLYPKEDLLEAFNNNMFFDNDPCSGYAIEVLHQMERHGNFSFEKRTHIYYRHVAFWEWFLESRSINCVIFGDIPHETFNYIAYLLCIKKNIATVFSYPDDLTGINYFFPRFMINNLETMDYLLKKSITNSSNDTNRCFENYLNYVRIVRQRVEKSKENSMELYNSGRNREVKRYFGDPKSSFSNSIKSFVGSVIFYNSARWKTKKLIDYYEKRSIKHIEDEFFIFYALHYEPECTSSPMGGRFASQLQVIDMLSLAVPKGVYIYVKEHPCQTIFSRDCTYYDEILKNDNVKLVTQRMSSDYLMKNSLAVATLTGTVIYESQIIGKPCLIFGHSIRRNLSGVYGIDSSNDLKRAISEIINKKNKKTDLEELYAFWKYLLENSFFSNNTSDVTRFYLDAIEFVLND